MMTRFASFAVVLSLALAPAPVDAQTRPERDAYATLSRAVRAAQSDASPRRVSDIRHGVEHAYSVFREQERRREAAHDAYHNRQRRRYSALENVVSAVFFLPLVARMAEEMSGVTRGTEGPAELPDRTGKLGGTRARAGAIRYAELLGLSTAAYRTMVIPREWRDGSRGGWEFSNGIMESCERPPGECRAIESTLRARDELHWRDAAVHWRYLHAAADAMLEAANGLEGLAPRVVELDDNHRALLQQLGSAKLAAIRSQDRVLQAASACDENRCRDAEGGIFRDFDQSLQGLVNAVVAVAVSLVTPLAERWALGVQAAMREVERLIAELDETRRDRVPFYTLFFLDDEVRDARIAIGAARVRLNGEVVGGVRFVDVDRETWCRMDARLDGLSDRFEAHVRTLADGASDSRVRRLFPDGEVGNLDPPVEELFTAQVCPPRRPGMVEAPVVPKARWRPPASTLPRRPEMVEAPAAAPGGTTIGAPSPPPGRLGASWRLGVEAAMLEAERRSGSLCGRGGSTCLPHMHAHQVRDARIAIGAARVRLNGEVPGGGVRFVDVDEETWCGMNARLDELSDGVEAHVREAMANGLENGHTAADVERFRRSAVPDGASLDNPYPPVEELFTAQVCPPRRPGMVEAPVVPKARWRPPASTPPRRPEMVEAPAAAPDGTTIGAPMVEAPVVSTARWRPAQARRWAGIGMAVAGGVLAALTPTNCRVAGELGDRAVSTTGVTTPAEVARLLPGSRDDIEVLFENPRNAVAERTSGRCALDWTVDGTARSFVFGRYARTTSLGFRRTASEFRNDYPFVDETRGDARAEAYKPRGQLIGGLALAGAGAVLALLPGGEQVRPTLDFRRRSFGVARSVTW